MQLPDLNKGVLVKRYKRFLADIETEEGLITAHCPNTGAMTGCAEPGWNVWYSLSDNPKRKYAATWELVDTEQGICSVNTGRANHLVREGIEQGVIAEVSGQEIKSEAKIPDGGGRFDLLVDNAYVEDLQTKRAMGITVVIYANENQVLNDNVYEYDGVTRPFLRALGRTLAQAVFVDGSGV